MKAILFMVLLAFSSLTFADSIYTGKLLPIVRIKHEQIVLKDSEGNSWAVKTNCPINIESITQFEIKDKRLKKGSKIRLSHKHTCRVKHIRSI